MGRNNWFEFKQFRVEQERAAMKVGTDGVLLGAWAPIRDAKRILDVGCGTGLIALMMAQRSDAAVDAIEIDKPASDEAQLNFSQSPWSGRLRVFHADFIHSDRLLAERYDLIVSNPPFFVNSLKTADSTLSLARHNDTLSFDNLLIGSANLLNKRGRLCVILPHSSFIEFKESARLAGFYLKSVAHVIPQEGKPPKRILMEFINENSLPAHTELILLDESGCYTENYKHLTKEFYTAF